MKLKNMGRSIRTAMLFPMVAINMVIILIFVGAILATRFFDTVRQSNVSNLQQMVQFRGEKVQQTLAELSYLTHIMADGIQADAKESFPSSNDMIEMLKSSSSNTSKLLAITVPRLVDTLSANAATGAFVMLNCSIADPFAGNVDGGRIACVYLNDEDLSVSNPNHGDLSLFYGQKGIARSINVPLSNNWDVELNVDDYEDLRFFSRPFDAMTIAGEDLRLEELGYWSGPITRGDGKEVMFYTLPLSDSQGKPYGVAGVEISLAQLRIMLDVNELGNSNDSFYMLSEFSDTNEPLWSVTNGAYSDTHPYESASTKWVEQPGARDWIINLNYHDSTDKATAVSYLFSVYHSGSPFGSATWGVTGVVDNKALFSNINTLTWFLVVATIVSLAAGIVFSILAANWASAPITRLSETLREMDPDGEIKLTETGFAEFDVLIDSIEELSAEVQASGARTLETIAMTSMPIGFYEIDSARERVFMTDLLFGWFAKTKSGSNFISIEAWDALHRALVKFPHDIEPHVYRFRTADDTERWLRIKTAMDQNKTFGIIVDITDELRERQRLKHERDTDPLTALYNRNGFFSQAKERLQQNPGKNGVMIFADLDNLKFINDNYGHDFGDRYICTAASEFLKLKRHGGIASRIAGDEFAVFIYGFTDRESMASILAEHFARMAKTEIVMPDDAVFRLRSSTGFAWYPQDSEDLDVLLRYADFAMYETKRTAKGQWREFSLESYLKNSFLTERNEDFNRFVEQNLVRYVFQPIVDIYSGEVFAYEALMRPQVAGLESPSQVLDIARTQAKLYQIERMTFFNVMEWIADNHQKLGKKKVFFNTIPDQLLSPRDIEELHRRFSDYFPISVTEITEGFRADPELLEQKFQAVRQRGARLAIDDYGSGFSNEKTLLQISPDYIKIDISLVKNVDTDQDKQNLVSNIVGYAHPRNIRVIAEGVETLGETEMMIRLGADYLQGFYIGEPDFEIRDIPLEAKKEIQTASAQYRDRRKKNI